MEMARRLTSALVLASAPLAACGLSFSGTGPNLGRPPADAGTGATEDASQAAPTGDDAGGGVDTDGGTPPEAGPSDGTSDSPTTPGADAGADASPLCTPVDAGAFDLSTFVLAGSASFNENADGRLTLTNSSYSQAGAAWAPRAFTAVAGYDLTWSLRVGPGDTAGDGVAFALLATDSVPSLGAGGDGLALRGIAGADGGAAAGYAVVVDMYQNSNDPTDLGPTTLKLVAMPAWRVVAETLVPGKLNDGSEYAVDVSWRAPSSLDAVLHAAGGALVKVSSSDPGFSATSGFLGFGAATGGVSNSHNEVVALTIVSSCD